MFCFTTTIRIHDTDAAGVVYFANFLRLMHEAYESWLGTQGISLGTILTAGEIAIPIVHAEADYRAPLVCGETIRVELGLEKISQHSFSLHYQIFNGINTPAATGKTTHVAVSRQSQQKTPLPGSIRTALEKL